MNTHNLKRLLSYIFKYKLYTVFAMIFAVLFGLSSIASTYFTGKAIDNIVGNGLVNFEGLFSVLILLGIVYFISVLSQWLISFFANKLAYKTVRDLRIDTFEKLNDKSLSYYDNHSHGDLISRFTNDLDSVSDALIVTITSVFSGIVIIISTLIIMLILNVQVTLVVILATPITFFVAFFVTKFSQNTFRKQQADFGDISSFISEIVGNQKVVKSLGYEDKSIERFEIINKRLYVHGKNAQFASSLVNPTTRFVDHISFLLVGVIGGLTALNSGLSIGTVSSFLLYSSQFSKPFNEISGITAQIQTAFAALSRIFEVIDATPQIPENENAINIEKVTGKIEFKNVAFSYKKNKPLIKNLNLTITPGSLVAIVGPTGAGKTTLVNLLMRFYEIDKGEILIDDINIKNITRDSLRRSFGMVLQDTWLFHGTIRDNIAYAKPTATDEEIRAAAIASYAHSFIKNLPQGYDTIIGDDAYVLSSGQAQLLTIARAMLLNPPMLILDEATSSIDTLTEIRIQKAFEKIMQGRTSFVIAHRLSTIISADIILVMDKGDIIETGTHQELLNKNGFYANLYYSQYN